MEVMTAVQSGMLLHALRVPLFIFFETGPEGPELED